MAIANAVFQHVCNGVTTCCAKKIKLFKAQTVKRGSLDLNFVLQPNNRDTKVANDIPCETNCPDNAKKIGTSADSPMYPKDNAAPESCDYKFSFACNNKK